MSDYDLDIICLVCGASPDLDAPRKIDEWDDAGHTDSAHCPNWSIKSFKGSEWLAHPNSALWHGEVVGGRSDETDYWYGYADCEGPPDVNLLLPEGWELLEYTIAPTSNNPAHGDPEATEKWSVRP